MAPRTEREKLFKNMYVSFKIKLYFLKIHSKLHLKEAIMSGRVSLQFKKRKFKKEKKFLCLGKQTNISLF